MIEYLHYPAPYGILSPASEVVRDNSLVWRVDGVDHLNSDIADVHVAHEFVPGVAPVQVISKSDVTAEKYRSFTVQTSFSLSTFDGSPDDIEEYIRKIMEAATQKAIEREFWTGALAKAVQAETGDAAPPYQYLASTDAQILGETGVKVRYGLALLEGALSEGIGERGTIHATRAVASALGIKGHDGVITTPIGNHLIAGTGYTGSGPDGEDAVDDSAWMYATGPVRVVLGPIDVHEDSRSVSVNTEKNTIHYTAYREVVVYWTNNNHFAVLVDLAADYA